MSAPSMKGVSFLKTIELLGLFPSKTFKSQKQPPKLRNIPRRGGRAGRVKGYFVRKQLVQRWSRQAGGLQLPASLRLGFAFHQRFRLSQEVGAQDLKGGARRKLTGSPTARQHFTSRHFFSPRLHRKHILLSLISFSSIEPHVKSPGTFVGFMSPISCQIPHKYW